MINGLMMISTKNFILSLVYWTHITIFNDACHLNGNLLVMYLLWLHRPRWRNHLAKAIYNQYLSQYYKMQISSNEGPSIISK